MNDVIYYFLQYGVYCVWGIIIFIFLKQLFSESLKDHHSNWNTLIDNFDYSPKEFYGRLKTELESHGVSNIRIRQVHINEGGVMSHSRIYLRATWKGYQYDICGAKFGDGFFISWWLLYTNSFWKIIISKIPFIGGWIAKKLYPVTYYTVDSASMFMTYAQASVVKVIEDITKDKGVRALSEADKKPVLNDIFKR
ncbi:hypothetical protein MC378_14255 [Polaribacter sp. MSW13]|uniref:Uncharacterized protein n=1 Tax=Polaribacter marinus TaxID=2916838 RepID=A0A9X2AL90_9FLAO|nr:hypothetical protein [Polaribacter marinus]MCI2230338.1 hypothetical protein [Polaribacter marinus]